MELTWLALPDCSVRGAGVHRVLPILNPGPGPGSDPDPDPGPDTLSSSTASILTLTLTPTPTLVLTPCRQALPQS